MGLTTMEVYLDVDYEEYCQDCQKIRTGRGGNSVKEAWLREKWGVGKPTVRVSTPRTLVDRNGIILAWILPSILDEATQVCSFLTQSLWHPSPM